MKGKEIAENLRNSKEKWTDGYLMKIGLDETPSYCVVGLKLHEAGIPNSFLRGRADFPGFRDMEPANDADRIGIEELYELNDSCDTKEELIGELENESRRDLDYPIEALVEYIKEHLLPKVA